MKCVPEICACYLDNILPKYSAKYVGISQSVRVKTNLEFLKVSTLWKLVKLRENGMFYSWYGTETT